MIVRLDRYLPVPRFLGRWISRVVLGLVCLSAAIAIFLVVGQNRFPASVFEYGKYGTYSGAIDRNPYPVLREPNGRESTFWAS